MREVDGTGDEVARSFLIRERVKSGLAAAKELSLHAGSPAKENTMPVVLSPAVRLAA